MLRSAGPHRHSPPRKRASNANHLFDCHRSQLDYSPSDTTMKFTVVVAGCACWISVANAILYPIHPVANTVLNGGSQSTISWIDEGSKPSLVDMGLISMDLYIDQPNSVSHILVFSKILLLSIFPLCSTHDFPFPSSPKEF